MRYELTFILIMSVLVAALAIVWTTIKDTR
jgi:hypothetical protein